MMFSKNAVYRFLRNTHPIVQIRLEHPHAPSIAPVPFPALVDTGAAHSVIPACLCQPLGHSFEDGLSESLASGIGEGTIRTFIHSIKLTVLFPTESDTEQTFDPIEFPCAFIEQFLPCVLLGQQDFLRLFQYTQNGHAGWFSLEQLTVNSDTIDSVRRVG